MKINYPSQIGKETAWEVQLNLWAQIKAEYGAAGLDDKLAEIKNLLREKLRELRALPEDTSLAQSEPDDLPAIKALRASGRRRIWDSIPFGSYLDRLRGALLGRCAGCILGAPVEFYNSREYRSTERQKQWADFIGDEFPPLDYWSRADQEHREKGQLGVLRGAYAGPALTCVPPDDDIAYTLLGLLVLEEYGPDFTLSDIGEAWVRYVPHAATAEKVALENLRDGVSAQEAGALDNPYAQLLGADIRADPWGYAAPGWPEKAAEMAYRDAYLTHRRNGIYGAMYFAAVIAAAFTVDDPIDALHIGLQEIPKECLLADAVRWALSEADAIGDYRDASRAVTERYNGMHYVHTINNACLTIFGLTVGGRDFTRIVSQTVSMGYDTDCNAATAGSIAGATFGIAAIPEYWWKRFNNTINTYLNGEKRYAIDEVVNRFAAQARRVFGAV